MMDGHTKLTRRILQHVLYLAHGACNTGAGTVVRQFALHYPGRRHPNAVEFRRLNRSLYATRIGTHTEHGHTGRPWTVQTLAYKDAKTAAVERQLWRSSQDLVPELGLTEPKVLEVLPDHQQNHTPSTERHMFPVDHFLDLLYEAPIVWSSDTLCWHTSRKRNVSGYTKYNIFYLLFNKVSQFWGVTSPLCTNHNVQGWMCSPSYTQQIKVLL
jgi:hypothetical protein